jgi:GR25 family glycosyltransferase involved in LPS biosynthesis
MEVVVKNPVDGTLFKQTLCNHKTKNCSFPYFYHPCCVSNVLRMFKDLTKLLDRDNISYFLIAGTALGWRRHNKGLIPWDDDIDIACFKKDAEKISKILEEMETLGYIPHHNKGNGTKIYPPYDYFSIDYSKNNKIHVDIALLIELSFEGKEYYGDFPNISIPDKKKFKSLKPWLIRKDWIFPLNRTQLYDIPCYTMNEDIKQLKFWYEDDVLQKAIAKPKPLPGTYPDVAKNKLEINFFPPAERLLSQSFSQKPNLDLGINRVLVINQEIRPDRLHWMIVQCNKNNLWLERVPAVSLSKKEYKKLEGTFWHKTNLFNMNLTEVSCFLSHIKCWEIVSKEKDSEMFLITEDDIEFTPCFSEIISSFLKDYNKDNYLIRLGLDLYNEKEIERIQPYFYEVGLATGTYAYLIHPKQARYFLNLISILSPLTFPVDLTIIAPDIKKFPTDRPYEKRFSENKTFLLHCVENDSFFKKNATSKRKGIITEWSSIIGDSTTYGQEPLSSISVKLAKVRKPYIFLLLAILIWLWLMLIFIKKTKF